MLIFHLIIVKEGERAQVQMQPQWGYGEQGNPPAIPKNCSLFLDVELLASEVLCSIYCLFSLCLVGV